jgi:predicted RNA binding protein with dsRBD fold (UPF0201 family)
VRWKEMKLDKAKIGENMRDIFTIAAFQVPKSHSILYRQHLTEEKLLEAVRESIRRGANVISIRKVTGEKE